MSGKAILDVEVIRFVYNLSPAGGPRLRRRSHQLEEGVQ